MIKINPTNEQLDSIINKHDLKRPQCTLYDSYVNNDKSYSLVIARHREGYRSVYVNENLFKNIDIKACNY